MDTLWYTLYMPFYRREEGDPSDPLSNMMNVDQVPRKASCRGSHCQHLQDMKYARNASKDVDWGWDCILRHNTAQLLSTDPLGASVV